MSGGPPPHGRIVGTFKVTHKNEHNNLVGVILVGDQGSCMFTLSEEDAEYYILGESYVITATQP